MAAFQPPASSAASPPMRPRQHSVLQRITFAVKIRLLQALTSTYFNYLNLPGIRDSAIQPTFTKVYPSRPHLTHRVFIPKSYKPDDALLPLYLDIHGGGFALMSPWCDDRFCSNFANDNKVLVVSIDYPKSPAHPYPAAVHSITDTIKAILVDETLPFDKTKVAVGGFSAGANLSLAVSQDEQLQGKIRGIAAVYPPVDLCTGIAERLATRPKDAPPDLLEGAAAMFDWAYLKPEQNIKDPQLSVTYADPQTLPGKVYIIGCEFDMLCGAAEIMAEKLAGPGERTGNDSSWEKNGIKWEKIPDVAHGFDVSSASGEKGIQDKKRGQQMYRDIAEWLFREVYN